jgi:hypothetical protein
MTRPRWASQSSCRCFSSLCCWRCSRSCSAICYHGLDHTQAGPDHRPPHRDRHLRRQSDQYPGETDSPHRTDAGRPVGSFWVGWPVAFDHSRPSRPPSSPSMSGAASFLWRWRPMNHFPSWQWLAAALRVARGDLPQHCHVPSDSETDRRVGIGGAGTFDGIVLSGIVAAYLA